MKRVCFATVLCTVGLLAGCATRPREVRSPNVTGGETAQQATRAGEAPQTGPLESWTITYGDAHAPEVQGVRLGLVGFLADRTRQEIVYRFAFEDPSRRAPRAVTVEDVSGTKAEMLVTDTAPRLAADGTWRGDATPQKKGDPALAWLAQTGDTFKIYRLTITTTDGKRLVLYEAAKWGAPLKAACRQVLGYDDAPRG